MSMNTKRNAAATTIPANRSTRPRQWASGPSSVGSARAGLLHDRVRQQGHDVLRVRHLFNPEAFDRFILDPIGYGSFDFADPISLDQYVSAPRMHSLYAAPLS